MNIEVYIREKITEAKRELALLLAGKAADTLVNQYRKSPRGYTKATGCIHDWQIDTLSESGRDWIDAHCKLCGLPISTIIPFDTGSRIYLADEKIDEEKTRKYNRMPLLAKLEQSLAEKIT